MEKTFPLPKGNSRTDPARSHQQPELTKQQTGSRLLRGLQHIPVSAASLDSAKGSLSSYWLQQTPRISERLTRMKSRRKNTVTHNGSNVLSPGFRLFLRTHNFT